MFGLTNNSLRLKKRPDGNANVLLTAADDNDIVCSPGISKSKTPLAKAKRVIASRSKWIQQKKRKPEELLEDTSIIHGIENIRMTTTTTPTRQEEETSLVHHNTTNTTHNTYILPPLAPPPPHSCTPSSTTIISSFSTLPPPATLPPPSIATPASWSASRAPPMKSCLLSQERARINHNATRARAAVPPPEEPAMTPTTTNNHTTTNKTNHHHHLLPYDNHANNVTPAPLLRWTHDHNATNNNEAPFYRRSTPKTVQFGTVNAAEFDFQRPAVEFTPMSSEVAQAKYSIDKKSQQAKQEEEETTEETKQNEQILAQWDDAFDELDDDTSDNDSSSRGRGRSSRRNNRRSSSFFSKNIQTLISTDDDDEDDDDDDDENDENKMPRSNSPQQRSFDATNDLQCTTTTIHNNNNDEHDDVFLQPQNDDDDGDEPLLQLLLHHDTSPIENSRASSISTTATRNNSEYQSPLLFNRESISTNSSDRMCRASLRSLHASGALLSPSSTSGSSLSDVSTEEIHDIRVSLERNLDNAFNNSNNDTNNSNNSIQMMDSRSSNNLTIRHNNIHNELFTFYLPSDQVAIASITNDCKFELHRDLYTFLTNAANRCQQQNGYLLEQDLLNQISVMDDTTTLQDMFHLLSSSSTSPICRYSIVEQMDSALVESLSNISMRDNNKPTTIDFKRKAMSEFNSNNQGDFVTKVTQATNDSLRHDCLEWEVDVLEELICQFRAIENSFKEQCVEYDIGIQKCQQWKEQQQQQPPPPSSKPKKMRNKTRNVISVEKLAKDVRILENELLREAESKVLFSRLVHETNVQQWTIHRKALSLIHSQEKFFTITDLLSFEPQVLSWNNVELVFPNMCDGSACVVGWHLSFLEQSSSSSAADDDDDDMEIESCDNTTTISISGSSNNGDEQVLGLPVVTFVADGNNNSSIESSSLWYQLLKHLFGDDSGNVVVVVTKLMEIVGLFEEKRSWCNLSNAVLTTSNIFQSVKMLDYDIAETEAEFNCKVLLILPPTEDKVVGLQMELRPPDDNSSILLLFWYDPKDLRTISRLLPSSIDVSLVSSQTTTDDDEQRCHQSVKLALKEALESNCNALVLQHLCRIAWEFFAINK